MLDPDSLDFLQFHNNYGNVTTIGMEQLLEWNDNWNETDSSGFEGNQIYDIGENFYDIGFDNCTDENETGKFNFKCDTSSYFIQIYNPEGTENNLILDWEDQDTLNGLWDEGEGERWYDFGEDNCPDELENVGGCSDSEAESVFNNEGTLVSS